jgi:CBS domain-containing protein
VTTKGIVDVYGDARGSQARPRPHRKVVVTPITPAGDRLKVVWTRGKGCHELAEVLGGAEAGRVQGDLAESCVKERADVLVSRKLPSDFDLVNVAVPLGFEPERVTRVVATVAGGPHSVLAVQTAALLGSSLGVETEMISAAKSNDEMGAAREILDQVGAHSPGVRRRVLVVEGISELVEDLDEGTLLVLGAPGGSWLSRSRTGPGARLRRTAQAGAVIVRSAPDRVFQFMGEPVYVSPLRLADDTLRIHTENTLAVADEGRLVGLVRREGLIKAGTGPVASVMEEALSVRLDETLHQARELEPAFGTDPIPVTDHDEYLVGGLSLPRA